MDIYQLTCTIISFLFNSILIYLIWNKSPVATGKYKWLMLYTAAFEIFWGAFDLPAAIIAHSVGCAFLVFRVNPPDAWLTPQQSSAIVLVYTAIFGASMAIFAGHFVYRYGSIDDKFGNRFTSGWKFGLIFAVPMFYALWWCGVVATFFWKNPDLDEYASDLIWRTVGVGVENISYIGAKFWDTREDGASTLHVDAWIGVVQMFFMVISSMLCVFGFGTKCYLSLSTQLLHASNLANNLQKQLFYALCLQTAIPLFMMHLPISFYFLSPMLDLDLDVASVFVASTITLYPAIDPLPSFFIIKNYRTSIIGMLRKLRIGRAPKTVPSNTLMSVTRVHVAL